MIIIHNITSEAAKELEDICNILRLTYSSAISCTSNDLYEYVFGIKESELVPFMIRFLHRINKSDYERIEIF